MNPACSIPPPDAHSNADPAAIDAVKPMREQRVCKCRIHGSIIVVNTLIIAATAVGLYYTVDTLYDALVAAGVFLCGILAIVPVLFHLIRLRFVDAIHYDERAKRRHLTHLKRVLGLKPDQIVQADAIIRRRHELMSQDIIPLARKHFWEAYNEIHAILDQEQRERHEYFLRELARHLRIDLDAEAADQDARPQ